MMMLFAREPYPADANHLLHRRLTKRQIHPDTGVPLAAAFAPRVGKESGVSVEDGRMTTPAATAAGAPAHVVIVAVCSVSTATVYACAGGAGAEGIVFPRPDPCDDPPNPSHALIEFGSLDADRTLLVATALADAALRTWSPGA